MSTLGDASAVECGRPSRSPGPAGPAGGGVSPLRAALLRWYDAGQVGGEIAVGPAPVSVAFDGVQMWVVNNGGSTVTKLQENGGALVGTSSVGTHPFGAAFDGTHIRTANESSNTVSKR